MFTRLVQLGISSSEKFHRQWGATMITVSVCLGSACHLKGANGVLEAFLALIEKHQAQASVQMAGSFCQGRCTEGVVVQIDDQLLTNVTRDQVHEIFLKYILKIGDKT
jgi:NADH-quinone oxidoreductase subunit G